jgi:hypothetical protein
MYLNNCMLEFEKLKYCWDQTNVYLTIYNTMGKRTRTRRKWWSWCHRTLSNANPLINRGALRCSNIAVLSFHHSWLITRIVTRVTRGVPHMGQGMFTLQEHLCSSSSFFCPLYYMSFLVLQLMISLWYMETHRI